MLYLTIISAPPINNTPHNATPTPHNTTRRSAFARTSTTGREVMQHIAAKTAMHKG